MKRGTSKDVGYLAIISLLLVAVLWINSLAVEVVEVTKIVRVEVPIVVEKEIPFVVEKEVPTYVDKYTNTIIVISPNATDEELIRAFAAIEYGARSHQSYVNNPSLQNASTGDTEWNIRWVENYQLLQALLERAYGKW